jgi:hypothetical protein
VTGHGEHDAVFDLGVPLHHIDGCGWIKLLLHPHDVVLQIIFRNGAICAMEMDQHLSAGDVAEADPGITDGGEKNGIHCLDQLAAQC